MFCFDIIRFLLSIIVYSVLCLIHIRIQFLWSNALPPIDSTVSTGPQYRRRPRQILKHVFQSLPLLEIMLDFVWVLTASFEGFFRFRGVLTCDIIALERQFRIKMKLPRRTRSQVFSRVLICNCFSVVPIIGFIPSSLVVPRGLLSCRRTKDRLRPVPMGCHGWDPWTKGMVENHAFGPWTKFMAVDHERRPWTRTTDEGHGRGPQTNAIWSRTTDEGHSRGQWMKAIVEGRGRWPCLSFDLPTCLSYYLSVYTMFNAVYIILTIRTLPMLSGLSSQSACCL